MKYYYLVALALFAFGLGHWSAGEWMGLSRDPHAQVLAAGNGAPPFNDEGPGGRPGGRPR